MVCSCARVNLKNQQHSRAICVRPNLQYEAHHYDQLRFKTQPKKSICSLLFHFEIQVQNSTKVVTVLYLNLLYLCFGYIKLYKSHYSFFSEKLRQFYRKLKDDFYEAGLIFLSMEQELPGTSMRSSSSSSSEQSVSQKKKSIKNKSSIDQLHTMSLAMCRKSLLSFQ